MGMNTYIKGVRDLDGEFKRMMDMKKLCDSKGFSYPKEVMEYFGSLIGESDAYIREEMETIDLPKDLVIESQDDSREFFDIEIDRIPKEVKILRFVNSY